MNEAKEIPLILTERLILRPWDSTDLIPFRELNANPEVMRHMPKRLTADESDSLAEKIMMTMQEAGFGFFAVEIKNTAPFIGFVGLSRPSFEAHFTPCIEIGWRISNKHWGRGYATEAARACLELGFNQLELKEIVSFTVPENTPSQRVMQKIGMTQDLSGNFDHPRVAQDSPLRKHVLYRLSKKGWINNISSN